MDVEKDSDPVLGSSICTCYADSRVFNALIISDSVASHIPNATDSYSGSHRQTAGTSGTRRNLHPSTRIVELE
ncbi:hypothetical protein F9C07_7280 [Aspergillus flavus]|uniref:Uncharacterized protein n=1 Tax=Aspergillus flavus (strain ATCC 200026 / FGSC A1120 / IAM 13836 / NRRL 3357 / JCM 12722 / SRRC 167) TaxID=332952 RepID=A0A7U2MMF4_ASPFN|nr:hypothetical protein F9C07_7280 [Aspergillus flavus]